MIYLTFYLSLALYPLANGQDVIFFRASSAHLADFVHAYALEPTVRRTTFGWRLHERFTFYFYYIGRGIRSMKVTDMRLLS